jgi:hypothetical protein
MTATATLSPTATEKAGRFRVRGRGILIDSGILVDSGVFIDSAEARRIPILLLDWPIEWPPRLEPLEMMWLEESVSIRATDERGRKAVHILMDRKPHTVRRIGTDAATGLPLYEHVWCPYVIPEPEYAKADYRYDLDQGEVSEDAFFKFGIKPDGGYIRVDGVDYQVLVLNVDGSGTIKTDGEYLVIAVDDAALPLGAVYRGRLIGQHTETGSPLFEGEPAKLPVKRRKKRRPDTRTAQRTDQTSAPPSLALKTFDGILAELRKFKGEFEVGPYRVIEHKTVCYPMKRHADVKVCPVIFLCLRAGLGPEWSLKRGMPLIKEITKALGIPRKTYARFKAAAHGPGNSKARKQDRALLLDACL